MTIGDDALNELLNRGLGNDFFSSRVKRSLYISEKSRSWVVRVPGYKSKSFAFKKYGGISNSLRHAERFRDMKIRRQFG